MAVMSEANALFELVNKSINLVQGIGRGWYRNSQAIQSFVEQVRFLRIRANNWVRLLDHYGPDAKKLLRPTLEEAMRTVRREEAAMKSRQASCSLRWSYRTLNIGEASIAIQSVIQAFEEISRTLQDYSQHDQILNRVTTSAFAALPFRSDRKYVPLQQPLDAVKGALESVKGPPVVTLYGQPGSGKTAMAKYLAIYYDKLRREQEVLSLNSRGKQGSEGESHFFSNGVFFLACGPGATSKALHEELWQNLGFRAMFDVDTQQDTAFVYSEAMLHKQLVGRLVDRSMLIILDDVWDTKVLERLLLPGKGLKYLVTSQYKRVWEDAVQINIAKPSLKDARKILVNHVVALPVGKELSHELQVCICSHPLLQLSYCGGFMNMSLVLVYKHCSAGVVHRAWKGII